MEYYKNNPNLDIQHPDVVDWVTAEYLKRTGEVFRDPDRQIRSLHQEGFLIKVKTGVYKYSPVTAKRVALQDFTKKQKEKIFKRDGYRCVICGKGKADGIVLHADHIKPKDMGGTATIENGQTLCASHNFRKKNLGQTETGKKMFIRLYEQAKISGDDEIQDFCEEVLGVYESRGINGHIKWQR